MLWLWAVAFWILLVLFAILNAGVREKAFNKQFSSLRAHQLSSVTMSLVVFVIAALMQQVVRADASSMLYVGIGWGLATVAFEFLAGHYVFGNSWKALLRDYNVLKGRLWLLVLASTVLAPYLVAL